VEGASTTHAAPDLTASSFACFRSERIHKGSGSQLWSGLTGGAGLDEYAVYGANLDSVKVALQMF